MKEDRQDGGDNGMESGVKDKETVTGRGEEPKRVSDPFESAALRGQDTGVILFWRDSFHVQFVNQKAAELLGKEIGELRGGGAEGNKDIRQLTLPQGREEFMRYIQRIEENGADSYEPWYIELGETPVKIRASEIRDVKNLMGIILSDGEGQRSRIEVCRAAVIQYNLEGRVVDFNSKARDQFGITRDAIGRRYQEVLPDELWKTVGLDEVFEQVRSTSGNTPSLDDHLGEMVVSNVRHPVSSMVAVVKEEEGIRMLWQELAIVKQLDLEGLLRPGRVWAEKFKILTEIPALMWRQEEPASDYVGGFKRVFLAEAVDENMYPPPEGTCALKVYLPITELEGQAYRKLLEVFHTVQAAWKAEAKNLREVQRIRDRLDRETTTRANQQRRHLNVFCEMYESGQERIQGLPIYYVVEELARGKNLQILVRDTYRRGLSMRDTLRYMKQICYGISVLHEHGYVNRDIRPPNVVIDEQNHVVKVTDFGMGGRIEDASHRQGSILFTAPEFFDESYQGPEADVFALAVLGHFMATGKHAYGHRGLSREAIQANIREGNRFPIHVVNPTLPRDWAERLETILQQGLVREPGKRISAQAMAEKLETLEREYIKEQR